MKRQSLSLPEKIAGNHNMYEQSYNISPPHRDISTPLKFLKRYEN